MYAVVRLVPFPARMILTAYGTEFTNARTAMHGAGSRDAVRLAALSGLRATMACILAHDGRAITGGLAAVEISDNYQQFFAPFALRPPV